MLLEVSNEANVLLRAHGE